MDEPEFDSFAKDYDQVLAGSIPEALNEDCYFAEYKIALMAKLLRSAPSPRLLDFGCGAGRSLPFLQKHFPDSELWGYDVSPASLKVAAERVPKAHLASDWNQLEGVEFDAIVAANVFHHIPLQQRLPALAGCRSALRAGGSMFVFEHNPRNPVTRHVFERCPFDVDAHMLPLDETLALSRAAGFASETHGYTLFFPRQLAWFRGLERLLSGVPLGAQYYVRMTR